MRKLRKIAILAVFLLSLSLFAACDAKVNVYRYTDDVCYYEDIEIVMQTKLVTNLEGTAALDADGNKWTMESYLENAVICANVIMESFLEASTISLSREDIVRGLGYRLVPSVTSGNNVKYYIAGRFPYLPFRTGEVTSENLFIGVVTFGCDSVFNGLHDEYVQKSSKNAVIDAVTGKFEFPSIDKAFPSLNNRTSNLLPVNEYIQSNRHSVGDNGKKAQYVSVYGTGYRQDIEFVAYGGYFGDSHSEPLTFETKYAVGVGWYIVAAAAGVACITVFLLVLHLKKKKSLASGQPITQDLDPELPPDGLIENQKIVAPTLMFQRNISPFGNPNPYGNSYNNQYTNPYNNPNGNPYGNPYNNPNGNPYNNPNANPYNNPYNNPNGNPYGTPPNGNSTPIENLPNGNQAGNSPNGNPYINPQRPYQPYRPTNPYQSGYINPKDIDPFAEFSHPKPQNQVNPPPQNASSQQDDKQFDDLILNNEPDTESQDNDN